LGLFFWYNQNGEVEMLKKLAKELRSVAESHPCDVLALAKEMKPPDSRHQRDISVDGVPIHLIFTLTVFGQRKMWQLSLQDTRRIPLPDSILDKILKEFFTGDFCEMPSLRHRGIVRQFLQEAQ
jgi:hypothetical protein